MAENHYGSMQSFNLGGQSMGYFGVASYYDSYDSIPFPFISCACDPEYEMIWCASQNGFLRGFQANTLQLQCSVEVVQNRFIYGIQSTPIGQITVTDYGMNIYNYGGLLRAKIGYELPESGRYRAGYAQVDASSSLLSLVGDFSGMYSFDLISGKKKKRLFHDHGSCIYSSPTGGLIGTATGDVLLFDSRMNKVTGTIPSFNITTQKVLRIGDYIIALGIDYIPKRPINIPDSIVKIYDARSFAMVPFPNQYLPNPSCLTLVDENRGEFMVSNIQGNNCIYSLSNGLNAIQQTSFGNIENEVITAATISSSRNLILGVSVIGGIHMNANGLHWRINNQSKRYPMPMHRPSLPISPDFRGIGTLYASDLSLLEGAISRSSDLEMFPEDRIEIPRMRRVLDESKISSNGATRSIKGIISNASRVVPNSIYFGDSKNLFAEVDPRKQQSNWEGKVAKEEASSIPATLRFNEMRLNHYGFYDIDFRSFNSTCYVGLENNIANSYLNAIVFLFWTIDSLRQVVLTHTCDDVTCVTCELKFLFRMFDQGKKEGNPGTVVHASNFYRMLAHRSDSIAYGILDDPDCIPSLRAERFVRFVLTRVLSEISEKIPWNDKNVYSLSSLFGITTDLCFTCPNGHSTSKTSTTIVNDLQWFQNETPFLEVVQQSLCSVRSIAWCNVCKKETPGETRREFHSLPRYLILALAQVSSNVAQNWRKNRNYFHSHFYAVQKSASDGISICSDVDTAESGVRYEVESVLSLVEDDAHGKSPSKAHLVLHSLQKTDETQTWFSFNDYCIAPADDDFILDFTSSWRTPICLVFRNTNFEDEAFQNVLEMASNTQPTPFYTPTSLGAPNMYIIGTCLNNSPPSYRQLVPEEIPGKGDLVAIDCEFIALNCEEADITPDGHRIVRKEADLRLGRVTCLTRDLEVFLDDYILCEDPVADYLTRFSGLTREDLEFHTSHHHLVCLKDAYARLRRLVDRGCIFVGHGLAKDFHTINILVPPGQIVDTVDIYYLPRNRRLSLKYLAKVVLKQNIQEGNHDSHEDARAALELYYKHLELVKEGKWEETLKQVYEVGKQSNYYGFSNASSSAASNH